MKLTNAPVLSNFTPNHSARRLASDCGSICNYRESEGSLPFNGDPHHDAGFSKRDPAVLSALSYASTV
jgi:hypothetical protein